jgi:hypothetical protein
MSRLARSFCLLPTLAIACASMFAHSGPAPLVPENFYSAIQRFNLGRLTPMLYYWV